MSKKAIILIDIQNDYFSNGKSPIVAPEIASANAAKVLAHFRQKGWCVVHIQHVAIDPKKRSVFANNTIGFQIHDDVKPLSNESVIQKHYPNSFRETELLNYLHAQEIEELFFAGMMTHMCIDATVRAAFDLGYNCTVIGDACATKDLEINQVKIKASEVHYSFLAALSFIYADVVNTMDFLNN